MPVRPLAALDERIQVTRARGHPERWKLSRYDDEHQETAEGRRESWRS